MHSLRMKKGKKNQKTERERERKKERVILTNGTEKEVDMLTPNK